MSEKAIPRRFYGYHIVLACFLFQGIGVGTYIAFGVFIKPLIAEFGWSRAAVSGASSMAFLLMGLLGILAGNLNDRLGPRIVMAVTGCLYGLGYLLLSQVTSVWQLYLFFGFVLGMGLSSIDVIALTTTARWFVRRRGVMTGLVKMGTGVGQLLMPMFAGLLIAHYGWRHTALCLGALSMLFIVGAGQLLRRDPAQMGQWPDGDGAPVEGAPPTSGLSLGEAMGNGQFWLVCTLNLLVVGCLMTVMVHIVPHAIDMGLDPVRAAGVLSTIGGASIGGRFLTGLCIDWMGSKRTMILCFGVLIVSFLWLQTAAGSWMLYLFALIYGLGHGGFFTLISPTVAEILGMRSHGVLIGIVVFCGTVGGALGPVLAGHIFDAIGSYQQVFWILTGVGGTGFLLALALRPAISKA